MKTKKLGTGILVNIWIYGSLLFATFAALIPVVSCVITAFKPDDEYALTNVMEMPQVFSRFSFSIDWIKEAFANFIIAWEKADMLLAFRNTAIIMFFVLRTNAAAVFSVRLYR